MTVLEGILVAEGDGRERHPIEEVDFDADAQGEWQVERNATVGVVDEEAEGRHEDHEPDDSTHWRKWQVQKIRMCPKPHRSRDPDLLETLWTKDFIILHAQH